MLTLLTFFFAISHIFSNPANFELVTPNPSPEIPISVFPTQPMQGQIIFFTFTDLTDPEQVRDAIWRGTHYRSFKYAGHLRVAVPVGIEGSIGTSSLAVTLSDGRQIGKDAYVAKRYKYVAPVGIPPKLGGNTATSAKALVTNLANENDSLLALGSADQALWSQKFVWPLAENKITDPYGYSRDTIGQTITHRGTDLHASIGTSVRAMNSGVVKVVKDSVIYGQMIVIDHGLGLQTFYMHMSKIFVSVGQRVESGEVIGLSGDTGYALGPHLHVTVRLNDLSIDPEEFMQFFEQNSI